MDQAKVIFFQVIIMFFLALIGFLLFKTKKITTQTSKSIGTLLVYVSLPAVIFSSFLVERTNERMIELAISFGMSFVILLVGIIISKLLNLKDSTGVFACSFSNPGFFGIPLIVASLIEGSVFYIAPFIAMLNVLQWTYGVYELTKDKKSISLKKIITTPALIAFALGLVFFFVQIPMPSIAKTAINYCSAINTPLAMFSVGIYLAQTNFRTMFTRLSNYKIAAIRLILIPLITVLILWWIPFNVNIKLALIIAASCPVGSNIAVLAEMNDKDYVYAVETVVISTLFSLATIPLIVLLCSFVWNV